MGKIETDDDKTIIWECNQGQNNCSYNGNYVAEIDIYVWKCHIYSHRHVFMNVFAIY